MRRKRLGSTGPELSVIGFGAWEAGGDAWGPNPSEDRVIETIRAGLDAGIDWIDTAEVYGDGTSETLVGTAVAGRTDVLIATKVAPRPDGLGFRADEIRRACAASLQRLGRERIDLYQLHWEDDTVPVEETWGAMAALVEEGLVGHIGVSNFDRDLIERCERIRHVDSLQPQFSLLSLKHRDLIRWCGERGTGVVCFGPLAYGLLTGAIGPDTEFDRRDWRSGRGGMSYYRDLFAPGRFERSLAVVDELRPIAERLGVTLAQLALAWVVHQPGVTAAIAGSRNPDHVRQNAAAGDLELDDGTLAEIEAVLPLGPGGA
jgi:aryl-alcohol dehydrogenase-like predicted oxidoreductase